MTVAKQQPDGTAPIGVDGELSEPDFLVWNQQFRRDGAIAVQSYGDSLRQGNAGLLSEAQVRLLMHCCYTISFATLKLIDNAWSLTGIGTDERQSKGRWTWNGEGAEPS